MIKSLYSKKIVTLFLVLLPIVEVITSLTLTFTSVKFTLGMIYKSLFIIYAIIYLIFIDKDNKKYHLTMLCLLLVYSVIHVYVTASGYSIGVIVTNFINLCRYITFPIAVMFFYSYNKKYKMTLQTINVVALIYSFVIVFAAITHTSFPTYDSIGIIEYIYEAFINK